MEWWSEWKHIKSYFISKHFSVHGEAIYGNLIYFPSLVPSERAGKDYLIVKCVLLSNQQCRKDFTGIVLLSFA
jgi:hypothetical protein